jgi:hypothetical protein
MLDTAMEMHTAIKATDGSKNGTQHLKDSFAVFAHVRQQTAPEPSGSIFSTNKQMENVERHYIRGEAFVYAN